MLEATIVTILTQNIVADRTASDIRLAIEVGRWSTPLNPRGKTLYHFCSYNVDDTARDDLYER